MHSTEPIRFTAFDIEDHTHRYRNRLPHWRQGSVTYFVTIRLGDSLPKKIIQEWQSEKQKWLKEKGINARMPIRVEDIPLQYRFAFETEFNRKINDHLDEGMGECIFREASVRNILIDTIEKSDAVVGDFVIMPNHVHMLLNEGETDSLEKALKIIKGASARMINLQLGRQGKVWQKDSFDHIVRNSGQLEKFQSYIARNPEFACLKEGEYSLRKAVYECV